MPRVAVVTMPNRPVTVARVNQFSERRQVVYFGFLLLFVLRFQNRFYINVDISHIFHRLYKLASSSAARVKYIFNGNTSLNN